MIFIGRQEEVALAKETTRGEVAIPTRNIKKTDFDFDEKIDTIIDEIGLGVLEDADDNEVVRRWSEGSLNSKILDITFGDILLAAFGTVNSDSVSGQSGVYRHNYSIDQSSLHQTYTIVAKNPNQQLAFPNCLLQSLELQVALNDYVRFTTSWMGKSGVADTSNPVNVTENHFVSKHASAYIADDLAGLSVASAIKVKDMTLSISYDIQSDDVLGQIEPEDFYNRQLVVEGTLELNYDSATYRDLAINSTAKALRIVIENSDVTIGTSAHPKIQIDLAKIKFTEFAKNGGLNDIITQQLTFKSFYSVSDSQSITASLQNTQVTY